MNNISNNLMEFKSKIIGINRRFILNWLKYSHFTETESLKNSINTIPRLMYGTAWKQEKTTDLVITAILNGFRSLDTACQPKHYREDLVGKAIMILEKDHNIKRKDLFLQTKFTSLDGQDPNRIPYDKNSELIDQVKQSFQKSLQNLNTDYIDSLLIHSPMKTFDKTMIVWNTFEEFYTSGKFRFLGISNIYNIDLLKNIWMKAKIKPSIIQNRFYQDSNYDKTIRKFCKDNSIVYQSFWTLTANPIIISSNAVEKLANKYNLTREQVFFKFVLQIGISPLTGTTNKQHMIEDLNVLKLKDFSNDEIKSIASLINEEI